MIVIHQLLSYQEKISNSIYNTSSQKSDTSIYKPTNACINQCSVTTYNYFYFHLSQTIDSLNQYMIVMIDEYIVL